MKRAARFSLCWVLGATVPSLIISVEWLLTRRWATLNDAWWLLLLVFACSLAALLLLHTPVYLIVRRMTAGYAPRLIGVAVSAALSFTPVFLMGIALTSDHDSPRGLAGKLSESFSLQPEALLWYLGFTLGGLVFLGNSGLGHEREPSRLDEALGPDA